jgi:thiamine biosynthesis lipoprotein ApbE
MDQVRPIYQSMGAYIESRELSNLDSHAVESTVPVSKELYKPIALSVELAKENNGTCNITLPAKVI